MKGNPVFSQTALRDQTVAFALDFTQRFSTSEHPAPADHSGMGGTEVRKQVREGRHFLPTPWSGNVVYGETGFVDRMAHFVTLGMLVFEARLFPRMDCCIAVGQIDQLPEPLAL